MPESSSPELPTGIPDMTAERQHILPAMPEGVTPYDQRSVDKAVEQASLNSLSRELQEVASNPVVEVEGRTIRRIAGGAPNPIEDIKNEIFGGGLAFDRKWTQSHGLKAEVVKMDPYTMVKQVIKPEEVFSELIETGLSDPTAWNRASMVIDEPETSKEFRIAARNGLLKAIILNIAMKTSRFDSVVSVMSGEHGLRPQAIAQWLVVDTDSRRVLTKLFELQGYEVAPTLDKNGNTVADPKIVAPLDAKKSFSDVKIDQEDIDKYLDEISKTLDVCPGIVTVAYTIFRSLGFPHGNGKYQDLYKHVEEGMFNLDPSKREVGPFIEKIKDPRSAIEAKLVEVLKPEGVLGLARSLDKLGEAELARAWQDTDMMLDVGDAVKDIRGGVGGGLNLSPFERRSAIINFDKLKTLVTKRRVSERTYMSLIDSSKISKSQPANRMGFVEKEMDSITSFFNEFVPGFLRGNRNKIG